MIEYIPAAAILAKVKDGSMWFGTDFNLNLYRGCCHGCIYCDSRSSCYRIDDFDRVRAKKDALQILEKELRSKRSAGVVSMGAMSDTYNPFEKQLRLTHGALALLQRYGFGVSIETKSALITRDADLLADIAKKSDVIAKITITTDDDSLTKKLEPNVSSSAERFDALQVLCGKGIFAGVLLSPLLPFINDTEENVRSIIRRAADRGARFVNMYMPGVTLRDNQREYYYEKLDQLFPGLSARYRAVFGEQYSCSSPDAKRLVYVMKNTCERYGLLYKMEDIISGYKKKSITPEQISLF